jgi:hypothetical protein
MKKSGLFLMILALLCFSAGLLFSFWPLLPLAVALLVLYGHTALGITTALFCDIIFGAPLGMFAFLHFPFLLFAVLCVGVRILSLRLVLERNDLDTV